MQFRITEKSSLLLSGQKPVVTRAKKGDFEFQIARRSVDRLDGDDARQEDVSIFSIVFAISLRLASATFEDLIKKAMAEEIIVSASTTNRSSRKSTSMK